MLHPAFDGDPSDMADWLTNNTPVRECPEKRLMLAVLIDAINCARNKRRRGWQESDVWLHDDREHFMSCVSICDHLNIDVAKLRIGLRNPNKPHLRLNGVGRRIVAKPYREREKKSI